MAITPETSWGWVKAMLHSSVTSPTPSPCTPCSTGSSTPWPRSSRRRRAPRGSPPDILAFTAFPKEIWRQIWSNNPHERLNLEIRRRTDVVAIFPDRGAAIRLIGAALAEQHDDWAEGRRYLGLDIIARSNIARSNIARSNIARSNIARSNIALITTQEPTTEKEDLTPAALTA